MTLLGQAKALFRALKARFPVVIPLTIPLTPQELEALTLRARDGGKDPATFVRSALGLPDTPSSPLVTPPPQAPLEVAVAPGRDGEELEDALVASVMASGPVGSSRPGDSLRTPAEIQAAEALAAEERRIAREGLLEEQAIQVPKGPGKPPNQAGLSYLIPAAIQPPGARQLIQADPGAPPPLHLCAFLVRKFDGPFTAAECSGTCTSPHPGFYGRVCMKNGPAAQNCEGFRRRVLDGRAG